MKIGGLTAPCCCLPYSYRRSTPTTRPLICTSRVTYVIDGEGVIQGVYHNEIVMSSHIRNALGALEELI